MVECEPASKPYALLPPMVEAILKHSSQKPKMDL